MTTTVMDLLDFAMPANGTTRIYKQVAGKFVLDIAATGFQCTKTHYGQLADVTGDGKLDYICAQAQFPLQIYDQSTMPFTNVTGNLPITGTVADTVFADLDNDLRPDLFLLRSALRPSGAIQDGANKVEAKLTLGNRGFSFQTSGVVTMDFNYKRFGGQLVIFRGANGGTTSGSSLVLDPANTVYHTPKNYNPATDAGIYVSYNPGNQTWTIMQSSGTLGFTNAYFLGESTSPISNVQEINFGWAEKAVSPTLFMNTPGGWVTQTWQAGLNAPVYCASVAAADFDNDMDMDLYFACRAGASNLPNILYENRGNGVFDLVPNAGGAAGIVGAAVGAGAGTSDSAVIADYDVDGFVDIHVPNGFNMRPTTYGGPDQLFRNRGNSNNWIEIDLQGKKTDAAGSTGTNRDGIGARVIATAGGVQQLRVQDGGYHRWSQNHQRLHFGLANNNTVNLRIEWPSGIVDIHNNVAANRLYNALEGGSIVPVSAGGGGPAESALLISDTSVSEGDGTAAFDVSLSPPSTVPVTVDYSTENISATAGSDYVSKSGTLLFDPPTASQQIFVPIVDDSDPENSETFRVNLSNPVDAILGNSSATATIFDNELSACGGPVYDTSTDRAVFIWQDCPNGAWHIRYTAAGGYIKYDGSVTSNLPFVSRAKYSVEASDIFDLSDPNALTFEQRVSPPYEDGADLVPAAGGSVCFDLEAPADAPVYIGATAPLRRYCRWT